MEKGRNKKPKTPKVGDSKQGGEVKKEMGKTLDKLFGPKKGDGSNRS